MNGLGRGLPILESDNGEWYAKCGLANYRWPGLFGGSNRIALEEHSILRKLRCWLADDGQVAIWTFVSGLRL